MTTKPAGDWDLRGRDYETELVGPITDAIIDADRLARAEHRNGFPNFALYRLIMCGDRMYLEYVRHWWVLFAIEWCRNRMRGSFSEDLATIAAWDSLQRVMDPARPILPADDAARSLGVELETYTRIRANLVRILQAALWSYWEVMGITYRVVRRFERQSER